MKNLYITLTFNFLFFAALAQTPCVDGMAGPYPCDRVDLMSSLTTEEIGGAQNQCDIWGWTSSTGREFAVVCKSNGTAFVEVTDPVNPVYLGDLPTHTVNSLWRDAKVYNDHAFIVSEAPGHGMQVFDLTQLLTIENPPLVFEEDAHYPSFGNAHNIVINEETGYAYGVGTDTFMGGLHIVNIQDPLNPVIAGAYAEDGYTHDAQVVVYHGPDTDYCGQEIAFNSNEDAVTIANVTDKEDCQTISVSPYPNSAYTHQGWLSEDHRFLFVNDELDEMNGLVSTTTTFIWDVTDLDAPELIGSYAGISTSIDHNMYVKWNQIFQSNYRSGLRILNSSRAEDGELNEIGFFDCTPEDDVALFSGTWSNYPYFASGTVVMTNMYGDFLVLQPKTISAEALKTIADGVDSVVFEVYTADDEGEVVFNTNDLPEGVFAGFDAYSGVGATAITLGGLAQLDPGTYDFQIVVSIEGVDEVFDASFTISEDTLPAISADAPDSGAVTDANPVFEWTDDFNGASLLLEVSDTPNFENILFSFEVTSSPFISPNSFLAGNYFWRLSNFPVCDEDPIFSNGADFGVVIPNVSEINSNIANVYPNPSQGVVVLDVLKAGELTIVNTLGERVAKFNLQVGSQSIDLEFLSSGMYLLQFEGHSAGRLVIE